MKNSLVLFYVLAILLFEIFLSCVKTKEAPPPPGSRTSQLISITWGLSSAKSIDSLSSGIFHNYKGTLADSLFFLWRLDPNIDVFAVNYNIAGVNTQAPITHYSLCSGIPISDTLTIAYDTVVTATPWKANYSDTLFITKVGNSSLVFQVRYSDAKGSGVEVDSLYKIRFNHNLY